MSELNSEEQIEDALVLCRACKKQFKVSTIMKHISHETKCKIFLSEKEIQTFKDQAAIRKKLKRSIRDKLFGDPNERARRRKEFYNPKKRKEAYQRTVQKIKAKHFESNLKETNEYREKYEKDGRSRNLIQFQATIDFFDNSINANNGLFNPRESKKVQEKIDIMKKEIHEKYKAIEIIIDEMVQKSMGVTDNFRDLNKIFHKILPGEHVHSYDLIHDFYHDLKLKFDFDFKEMAKELFYPWSFKCACQKCTFQKKLNSKGVFEFKGKTSMKCKSCPKIFEQSAFLKHVIHSRKCKSEYTNEDIQSLKDNAHDWNRRRKNEKSRLKYDPVAYAEKQKAEKAERVRKGNEKWLPKLKARLDRFARDSNLEFYKDTLQIFHRGSHFVTFCTRNTSNDYTEKVEKIHSMIEDTNKQILIELDEKFELAKVMTLEEKGKLEKLYRSICNKEYKEAICYCYWGSVKIKVVFAFEDNVNQMGFEFDWSAVCPYTLCKHDIFTSGPCVSNYFGNESWTKYLSDQEAKRIEKLKNKFKHKCVLCSSVFSCKRDVRKHHPVHGKKEILLFQNCHKLVLCLKCNISFQSKEEFKIHQGKIHAGKKQIM